MSSCQHVECAPPGAMACECPPCYHLPPGEQGHLWALLTLQFLGGSWICVARHPCKAGLSEPYVPVWSLQASDAPESVTPQGILSIMGNSQHVAQECRHWHGSHMRTACCRENLESVCVCVLKKATGRLCQVFISAVQS